MNTQTVTAQAFANIAFIKYRLAKLDRTDGKAGFGTGNINGRSDLLKEKQDNPNEADWN